MPSQSRVQASTSSKVASVDVSVQGYQAVWSNNSTVLKCEPSQGSVLAPWFIPTAVIATVIGICLLGAVGLLVWLRVTILLRWKWQRERDLLKYRQKGVPNGGPATIVVTDVEGYSGAHIPQLLMQVQ